MRFANAGHPLPFLLRRAPETVARLEFAGGESGPALGIFEAPTFATAGHVLCPHDLVILFTDGLFEVLGDDDKEFGQERLLAAVRERQHLPAEALFDELIRLTRQHSASGEYGDDVCLLGVEVERTAASREEP
jgi:sigma-B regulation protein RsbU (phosphoserine phosphatase)